MRVAKSTLHADWCQSVGPEPTYVEGVTGALFVQAESLEDMHQLLEWAMGRVLEPKLLAKFLDDLTLPGMVPTEVIVGITHLHQAHLYIEVADWNNVDAGPPED